MSDMYTISKNIDKNTDQKDEHSPPEYGSHSFLLGYWEGCNGFPCSQSDSDWVNGHSTGVRVRLSNMPIRV